MARYLLADLYTTFSCHYPILQRRCEKYEVQSERHDDISMGIPISRIQAFQAEHPHLTLGEAELILLSARFSAQILHHNGLVLHASAIAHQGRAVLFSAPSGVGKSTHTQLWQKQFGAEQAVILNNDKPALRLLDQQWWVYGELPSAVTAMKTAISAAPSTPSSFWSAVHATPSGVSRWRMPFPTV